MNFKRFILFAVTFVTAFFLSAEIPSVTYKSGRVDGADLSYDDKFEPEILDLNQSMPPHLLVATGIGGRIESIVDDKYWRLGSNSMARWYSSKTLWLHSGSALFCSTENDTIHLSTTESNATFSGTGTIIIEATKNGGFKFIPLEAKGTISTEKGGSKKVVGGRMLLILGNPSFFGDAFDIDIMLLIKSSRLVNSYPTILPTFKKIGLAIYIQELKLRGKYDALIGDATTEENLQMWKFGNNVGNKEVEASPKKGFFGRFFGDN